MKEKTKISPLKQSTGYKIFIGTIAMLLLLLAVGSSLLWAGMYMAGTYTRTPAYTVRLMHESMLRSDLRNAIQAYREGDDVTELYADTNFRFCIRDENMETLVKSDGWVDTAPEGVPNAEYIDYDFIYIPSENYTVETGYGDEYTADYGEDNVHTWVVRCYGAAMLDPVMPAYDRYTLVADLYEVLYTVRYFMPVFILLFAVLWVIALVWLLCAAGYHRGEEDARIGWTERIPLEIWLGGIFFGVCLEIALLDDIVGNGEIYAILLGVAFVLLDNPLIHGLFVTLAVRVKTHSFLRTTLCYHVLRFAWRILCAVTKWAWKVVYTVGKWMWRGIFRFFARTDAMLRGIPRVWKTVAFVLVNLLFDCFVFAMGYGFGVVMVLLKDALLGIYFWWYAVGLRRLEQGAKALADGAPEAKIDTRLLPRDLHRAADTIHRVGDGMNRAVEERMKSERFRTELITNVSHDIKTPLTSIVNYVDLLGKENITEEPAAEYIAVLARQSARLKKLTEDLVEASKAATGNIAVHAERCDAALLLGQTAGEYEEKLRAANLTVVLSQGENPLPIQADGRLLWRVTDNLMNNIVKYALPGSRVYLSATEEKGSAVLTFRNISRDPLNLPPEELLNRFTRGDASRSTEGSGLGLSIATSLTELQGGKLALHVDGDLFKVTLTFPLVRG